MPLAVGVLGLAPADLDEMTPNELRMAIAARYAYDDRLQRNGWEQARIISWFAVSPHMKKGSNKKANDLFPLTWDKVKPDKRITSSSDFTAEQLDWIKRKNAKDGIEPGNTAGS